MNIYENCPTIENDRFLVRLFSKDDAQDLLKVYSDKKVLPFLNNDNCDGDNFYYSTIEKMNSALDFWKMSYENGWFARLSIVDKNNCVVIGTIELCLRVSDDEFNNMGILRVDVSSDSEEEETLYSIFSLITPHINELIGGEGIITKAPIYAVDRIAAIKRAGYVKSEHYLKGKTGYLYSDYWTII